MDTFRGTLNDGHLKRQNWPYTVFTVLVAVELVVKNFSILRSGLQNSEGLSGRCKMLGCDESGITFRGAPLVEA